MKNVVKILEEMFAEKQAKNSRPFFAVLDRVIEHAFQPIKTVLI
jgi:hypothetical protein